jgi:DeoR/GlpR family transcriptional regulator of sugar metabolism
MQKDNSSEPSITPSWVDACSQRATEWKKAMAYHVATHLIKYGTVAQIGSGTTFSFLMDQIINVQVTNQESLDLVVMTNNLEIVEKGRDEKQRHPHLLGGMQIILTGGAVSTALHSLVGPFAADGVKSHKLTPHLVLFGAEGLTFHNKFLATYHFDDEIATQEAYAARPAKHRLLMCDHTKLGNVTGWEASISPSIMLAHAERCTIITTCPDDNRDLAAVVQSQVTAFDRLIESMTNQEQFYAKDFALRVLNRRGEVIPELSISLSERRKLGASHISRKHGELQENIFMAGHHNNGGDYER